MMRRVAYVLCAALCVVSLAAAARAGALVTYTWQTQSQSNPGLDLKLSFTVDGDVSIGADSQFVPPAGPTDPTTPFPFPPELVSFNLQVGILSITLDDFTSGDFYGFPLWSLGLSADPADLSGDLSLFFINSFDSDEISGAREAGAAFASTGAVGTIGYTSDDEETGCFLGTCTFIGTLVASEVPEPPGLWILIANIVMLGLLLSRQFRAGGGLSSVAVTGLLRPAVPRPGPSRRRGFRRCARRRRAGQGAS